MILAIACTANSTIRHRFSDTWSLCTISHGQLRTRHLPVGIQPSHPIGSSDLCLHHVVVRHSPLLAGIYQPPALHCAVLAPELVHVASRYGGGEQRRDGVALRVLEGVCLHRGEVQREAYLVGPRGVCHCGERVGRCLRWGVREAALRQSVGCGGGGDDSDALLMASCDVEVACTTNQQGIRTCGACAIA